MNKPTHDGIWEWFEENGTKRLVLVCDVSASKNNSYLRVYWAGGYYDVNDSVNEPIFNYNLKQCGVVNNPAEWTGGTWGQYMGKQEDFKENELYLGL